MQQKKGALVKRLVGRILHAFFVVLCGIVNGRRLVRQVLVPCSDFSLSKCIVVLQFAAMKSEPQIFVPIHTDLLQRVAMKQKQVWTTSIGDPGKTNLAKTIGLEVETTGDTHLGTRQRPQARPRGIRVVIKGMVRHSIFNLFAVFGLTWS